jgi:hypothetical protein
MGRLFILLLMLPWWGYLPLAGGAVWVGEQVYVRALQTEAAKAAALAEGPPAAVDLAAFDLAEDRHGANEVNLRGWIDTTLNYELVKRSNGVTTSRRYMYALFGESDPAGSKLVRAALVLTEKEKDAFVAELDRWAVDVNAQGYVFEINGFGSTSVTLGGLAFDAIAEQGLRRADDFVFIEPFFDGREAALAPHGVPAKQRKMFWLIAAGIALFGLGKRMFARKDAIGRSAAAGPDPHAMPVPKAPLASGIAPDTPLGRITARRVAPADSAAFPAIAPVRSDTGNARARDSLPDLTAPVSEPTRRGLSNFVFLSRLVLAMIFVGALAYDPAAAIGLLSLVLPIVAVLAVAIGLRRLLASRRAARTI